MSGKQGRRTAARAARRILTDADRATADKAIIAGVLGLARGAKRVAAYQPMVAEPGGPGLLPALAEIVETVIVPVLRPDLDLHWTIYGTAAPDFGPAAIADADLVLVPALAVDRTGTRLGQGGGSYDRALVRVRPGVPIIALLYDGELCDVLPVEPHDQRVGAALTPAGLITLRHP